jgi:hypothetical protein
MEEHILVGLFKVVDFLGRADGRHEYIAAGSNTIRSCNIAISNDCQLESSLVPFTNRSTNFCKHFLCPPYEYLP